MRRLRRVGYILLILAVLCVAAAWYGVWSEHRREVQRLRLVWGQDTEVPWFNPLRLVDPRGMPLEAWEGYIFALALGVPGLLCIVVTRRRAGPRRNSSV